MNRSTSVAFTGHRTYRGEADEALRATLRTLYAEGYRTFLGGMAVGFDLAAAEAVLDLRDELHDVRFVAIIPFASQGAGFAAAVRHRYEKIVAAADERITLSDGYFKGCYQVRNRYLVDHASVVVAWYNGSSGGTQQTFLSALHRGLRVENLGTIRPEQRLF